MKTLAFVLLTSFLTFCFTISLRETKKDVKINSLEIELNKMKDQNYTLNTLVQKGTDYKPFPMMEGVLMVNGNGTELSNTQAIQNRAKRKLITQKMILSLVDVANRKGKPERAKAYWNTYHCQSQVYSAGGRLYGKYCKNRFCTLCCSIRKAEIINKYLPIVKTWEQPHFVTLTVKACSAYNLPKIIDGVIRAFRIIKDRHKKRHRRGKGNKLIGIKSLECNFNATKKTYNPHLHLIVPDEKTAEVLIQDWKEIWNRKGKFNVSLKAQHKRPVKDNVRDLIETVKYGSKIFSEPDVTKKSKQKVSPYIYVSALDNIFTVMQNHRIFERFGFNLPKSSKKDTKSTPLLQYDEWKFDLYQGDWINTSTEQVLTAYTPHPNLTALLESNIDTELE